MAFLLEVDRIPTAAQTDCNWVIEATRWVGPGVTFMGESEYRFVGQGLEDEDTVDISANYQAAFGAAPVGSLIFVRARWVSLLSGLASSWVYATAEVVPP